MICLQAWQRGLSRWCLLAALIATGPISLGCNSGTESTETPPATEGESTSSSTSSEVSVVEPNGTSEANPASGVASRIPADAPPQQITQLYFDAVSKEDIGLAEQLLSPGARQAFSQLKIQPSMPAPANSTFRVGETLYNNNRKEIAYVETFWTTPGEGIEYVAQICLRPTDTGQWRISGMMMADQEVGSFTIDFENVAMLQSIHDQLNAEATGDSSVREADAGSNPIR